MNPPPSSRADHPYRTPLAVDIVEPGTLEPADDVLVPRVCSRLGDDDESAYGFFTGNLVLTPRARARVSDGRSPNANW